MATDIFINNDSVNGLLPPSTKPLHGPMLTYHQYCSVAFAQEDAFKILIYEMDLNTVYPKKYAHGFCFAVLCCGYTLTNFPISIRLTSLALWQSNDCPSASKATLMNMDKYFMLFIMNDCITTTKRSATKPCAYFLVYTLSSHFSNYHYTSHGPMSLFQLLWYLNSPDNKVHGANMWPIWGR